MELKDEGAEVVGGGNPFKKRIVLIVAVLVGLAVIVIIALLLLLFVVLPGRRGSGGVAQATATPANLAEATLASTPSALPATGSAPTSTPVIIPTVTPAAATTPSSNVGSTPNPLPGLYATGIRVDPNLHKNQPIDFHVTIFNSTGLKQSHKVCAEIYHPGDQKSFGITSCLPQTIPLGTSEVSTGTWKVTGLHACLAVRARAVIRDTGDVRVPLRQTGGGDLWLDFQVCP